MSKQDDQQVYLGYFATILVALIASTVVGRALAPILAAMGGDGLDMQGLAATLSTGLFFAICVANPVGYVIRRHPLRFLPLRAVLGFAAGIAIHITVIEPYVGVGLTRITLLLIASAGVPAMVLRDGVDAYLRTHGSSLPDQGAALILRVARWPDRYLFVILTTASLGLFAQIAATVHLAAIGVGAALVVLTVVVALRSAGEGGTAKGGLEEWLRLIPEPVAAKSDPLTEAADEARRMFNAIAPGAVFFGGLIWLAVKVMPLLRPALGLDAGAMTVETGWQIALIGLGLIALGLLVAVGLGIVLLHVIGHYARWTRARLREASLWMLKSVALRNIGRDAVAGAHSSAGKRPSPRK